MDKLSCSCLTCRLERSIFDELFLDSDRPYASTPDASSCGYALMALVPILGRLLKTIDYDDCERYWRLALEARVRAIDPALSGEVAAGRA